MTDAQEQMKKDFQLYEEDRRRAMEQLLLKYSDRIIRHVEARMGDAPDMEAVFPEVLDMLQSFAVEWTEIAASPEEMVKQ